MEHYRRKPLQLIDPILPITVNDTLETVVDPTHTPSSSSPEILTAAIPALGKPAGTETIPSPAGLVHQATAILEEEIADPPTPSSLESLSQPSASPTSPYSLPGLEAAMHDFVETVAQVINPPSPSREQQEAASLDPETSVPLLRSQSPLHPGEVAQLSFQVHNESHQAAHIQFFCTDLYNGMGDRIPSQTMTVTPPNLSLAPNTTVSIMISVQLPEALTPGDYSGLLMATGLSYLKTVISLNITA